MRRPSARGCLVSSALGLVVLYVGYVGSFWAFGEAGPLDLVVLNVADEPISVTLEPDMTSRRIRAGTGDFITIDGFHKETNFLYYLVPFLPPRPEVPPWIHEVIILDAAGAEVWSADLRDRPDLWNSDTSSWQLTVYKDRGAWAVRMPLEGSAGDA